MAEIPGLNADVFFGDPDAPPPNWRKKLVQSEDDEDVPLTDDQRAELVGILGFDPRELDEEPAVTVGQLSEAIEQAARRIASAALSEGYP